jgi:hypothetical protein
METMMPSTEMTTMQLLIVNLPQILMSVAAVLGALGIGKIINDAKTNRKAIEGVREETQLNKAAIEQVGGQIQENTELTDNMSSSMEKNYIQKDGRLEAFLAEVVKLKAEILTLKK